MAEPTLHEDPRLRWRAAGAGRSYATRRWSSERRRRRDVELVDALLREHVGGRDDLLLLDAPCGAGRLREVLAARGRVVGLDVSPEMLRAAGEAGARDLVRGDITRLPFRDAAFDVVLACRVLHHLAVSEELERAVAELVRVSRGWVLASFWDAGSLPARHRRVFPRKRRSGRVAHDKRRIEELFRAAGAEVEGWKHSFYFLSRQTFVAARRHAGARS